MAFTRIERFSRLTVWGRRYFFRGVSANNEVVVQSEAYNSEAARDNGIKAARRVFRDGEEIDL